MDGAGAATNKVTYTGGSGDDTIKGGPGEDSLSGNNGNDTITGGLSADTIEVGGGSNTVIFTSGLTIDSISQYTADDIGAFNLTELEKRGYIEANKEVDFVTGSNTSVISGDTISMQTVDGDITLSAATNVLNYTVAAVANAAALETALEANGGMITSAGALVENDAFVIQYKDSDTSTQSFAVAYLKNAVIPSATKISDWEVIDIATSDFITSFSSSQFAFVA